MAVAAIALTTKGVAGVLHVAHNIYGPIVLVVGTVVCSAPLFYGLARELIRGNFGVDLLAVLSIVTALALHEYWVSTIIVLMLSGGKALDDTATLKASSVLTALAKRMPQFAHVIEPDGTTLDRNMEKAVVGDELLVHPPAHLWRLSPEQKVGVVRELTRTVRTIYVGDGVNDAPAMMNATVAIALGGNSDITIEAAGAVILESSLTGVDELLHISSRMRTIALQSALGGMGLSVLGMATAAAGWLSPLQGALLQEAIDVSAVLNSLRMILTPANLIDFGAPRQTSSPGHTIAAARQAPAS